MSSQTTIKIVVMDVTDSVSAQEVNLALGYVPNANIWSEHEHSSYWVVVPDEGRDIHPQSTSQFCREVESVVSQHWEYSKGIDRISRKGYDTVLHKETGNVAMWMQYDPAKSSNIFFVLGSMKDYLFIIETII